MIPEVAKVETFFVSGAQISREYSKQSERRKTNECSQTELEEGQNDFRLMIQENGPPLAAVSENYFD